MHEQIKADVFKFLDSIKPTDVVSMYDYSAVIKDTFALTDDETHRLINLWLRTFSERHLAKTTNTPKKHKETLLELSH